MRIFHVILARLQQLAHNPAAHVREPFVAAVLRVVTLPLRNRWLQAFNNQLGDILHSPISLTLRQAAPAGFEHHAAERARRGDGVRSRFLNM